MVHRLRVLVPALAATAALGLISPVSARAGGGHTCPVEAAAAAAKVRPALGPTRTYSGATPITVFLQRSGATLKPGYDDSAADVSALVYGRGLSSLTVPAFSGGDRAWGEIVACVERGLDAYAVDVVDERPSSGPYIMMMVGGRADMLGYSGSISGVAPYSGEVLPTAIGFVFAAAVKNDVGQVCQSALHEIGHTLGLDHAHECRDTMSYLHGCGAKSFTDIDAACGEYGARECADGAATQNSHEVLARNVGLRGPGQPLDERTEDDGEAGWDAGEVDVDDGGGWMPEVEEPNAGEPGAPPTVELIGVEIERVDDYRMVYVAAWVTGAERIELGWATPDEAYLFDCDRLPEGAPVTCEREGAMVIYALRVGDGDRMFALRVTNRRGEAITDPRHLERRRGATRRGFRG